jgi:hypothetical protein
MRKTIRLINLERGARDAARVEAGPAYDCRNHETYRVDRFASFACEGISERSSVRVGDVRASDVSGGCLPNRTHEIKPQRSYGMIANAYKEPQGSDLHTCAVDCMAATGRSSS